MKRQEKHFGQLSIMQEGDRGIPMLQLSAQSPRPLGLGQLRKRMHTVVISCKRWSA